MLNARVADGFTQGLRRLAEAPVVEWLNRAEHQQGELSPPNAVFKTSAESFLANPALSEEVFGPAIVYVVADSTAQMLQVAQALDGNLTATIHADDDLELAAELLELTEQKAGRVIFNGYPTGVEVCPSMQHGGPYPASSASTTTSVGADATTRFARFVAFQSAPQALLPKALTDANPLAIVRRVNGTLTSPTV